MAKDKLNISDNWCKVTKNPNTGKRDQGQGFDSDYSERVPALKDCPTSVGG